MSHYQIIIHNFSESKYDAELKGLLTTNWETLIPNPFNAGESVDESQKFVILIDDEESKLGVLRDCIVVQIQNDELLYILSAKAVKVLQGISRNLSFHRVDIRSQEITIDDYSILNVTQVVDCIDHENSRLIYWDDSREEVYNINELVLDESKIPETELAFLLGEVRGSVIVFHSCINDELEKSKITGFQFSQPSEFVL